MSRKLNERFLKERYEKDDSYFTVYEHYRPNYYSEIVVGKFYSRFDQLDLSKADPAIVDAIKTCKAKLPRERYPWPVTESHRYGWYDPQVYLDRHDPRFYACIKMAPFIKHEVIFKQDKTMKRPKFTGIPFRFGNYEFRDN